MRFLPGLALLSLALGEGESFAKTYYVGRPENAPVGSQVEASLASLNGRQFKPGDVILLESGRMHEGPLRLDAGDPGSPAAPVKILASDSRRKASIRVPKEGGSTVEIRGASHVVVEGLKLVDDRVGENLPPSNGLVLSNEDPASRPENLLVRDVEASGFRGDRAGEAGPKVAAFGNGILVRNGWESPGLRRVSLERVAAHGNDWAGVQVAGDNWPKPSFRHEDVVVRDSVAHSNLGMAGKRHHSGHGIVVSNVARVELAGNVAFRNGERNEANGGPIGIWAWDAEDVWIHDNVSFANRTASKSDGGGIDVDGSVKRAVVERNLTFDNDGAGVLLCSFDGSEAVDGVRVRDNVSLADGRKNGYAGLTAYGDVVNSEMTGNVVARPPCDGTPGACFLREGAAAGVDVRGNSFLTPVAGVSAEFRGSASPAAAEAIRKIGKRNTVCRARPIGEGAPSEGFRIRLPRDWATMEFGELRRRLQVQVPPDIEALIGEEMERPLPSHTTTPASGS